ncbi:gem-associated protein 4 [Lampris incognitus]|uniref:gem-associated protein 4 n=1 Tax=Lampris incognitus TaxID=2546036 RepID=UPI0024B4D029|nr:gem-associated protein 4 [Lampris incognitus]
MDKESAILQGGFLLANKVSLPASLSTLQKDDWPKAGHPVLQAVRELCKQVQDNGSLNTKAVDWRKKIICVLWCKLWCRENREDIETGWKENPFFQIQNGLPEVNYVVLLELVKSMAAAETFGYLLRCLPRAQITVELSRLAQHVACSPTSEDDVRLFLGVFQELWRGGDEWKAGEEDSLEKMLTDQFARLSSQPPLSNFTGQSPQAAKRLKLDTLDLPPPSPSVSPSTTDVLYILLHTLRDLRDHVSTTDLCHQALSVSLNAVYTSFLINQVVILPIKQKMHFLSKVVSLRVVNDGKLTSELLQEVQRDLRASHSPSLYQPSRMTLNQALRIVTELIQFWQDRGLLKMSSGTYPTYSAFKLAQSIQRTLEALEGVNTGTINVMDEQQSLTKMTVILRGAQECLAFPVIENSPEMNARVTMAIINYRLENYQDFAVLLASEKSWATSNSHWMDCLERNQAAFRQHETLITLSTTFMSACHSNTVDVSQSKKLLKIIVDIFSQLPLEDKNKVLAAMMTLSSRGLFGVSLPSALTDGFGQELNMAFNCIIQGRGDASVAMLHSSLNTAVALIARVAFQNPKAALRSCCHSAIFNKGGFSLMATILQQLHGLRGREIKDEEQRSWEVDIEKAAGDRTYGRRDAVGDQSLLCCCLQETIKNKLLSANEKEQFLKFLGLLMTPVIEIEGEERRQSFLLPQEVVCSFVLPHLSSMDYGLSSSHGLNFEASLQLLQGALSLELQEPVSSPHWVLNCSPFPLLYILAQHLHQATRCWEQPQEAAHSHFSMDTKELLVSALTTLGYIVGREVAVAPSTWSRALFWLYNKMEQLDWTVRFHLKTVWGEHFKNEVPSSLMTVCALPEQEWTDLELPHYGQGTGLLAWMECCSISHSIQTTMLSCLSLDQCNPDHCNMFSKGLLVALTQTLPWCSISEWTRLLRTLRELLCSGKLHVPYSLEYVDYLPLLDLRDFSYELRLSVILLRVLQFLCGPSCSNWLPVEGWSHVGRLYAHAVREILASLKSQLPLSSTISSSISPKTSATPAPSSDSVMSSKPEDCSQASASSKLSKVSKKPEDHKHKVSPLTIPALSVEPLKEERVPIVPSKEVLFVLSQLFCHVQHVQVMMPGGQCEPLFLCALEILSHYKAIITAFPDSSTPLESDNTRHFFSTITNNLENEQMKAVLQQNITQLMSSVA